MTLNGGLFVTDAFDTVGVYCWAPFGPSAAHAQMVGLQIGGFL